MGIIQWESVTAASSYIIEYREVGTTTWITSNPTANSTFNINNVEDCTFLEVRIKSQCSTTNNESDFSQVFFLNSECGACSDDYCSFGDKNTSDEYIDEVEIVGVFSNQSGVSENGYENFLGSFDLALKTSETYTLRLTPGHTGQLYPEFFTVAIDFDHSGSFQSWEIVYQDEQATETTVTGEFTVPNDAVLGTTRMRVIMRYQVPNGVCDETTFEFGEVEDYCVDIVNTVSVNSLVEETHSVYPNPSQGMITIDGEYDVLEFYDINGTLQLRTLDQINQLDLSSWASGLYLIKISSGEQSKIHKWIKSDF